MPASLPEGAPALILAVPDAGDDGLAGAISLACVWRVGEPGWRIGEPGWRVGKPGPGWRVGKPGPGCLRASASLSG